MNKLQIFMNTVVFYGTFRKVRWQKCALAMESLFNTSYLILYEQWQKVLNMMTLVRFAFSSDVFAPNVSVDWNKKVLISHFIHFVLHQKTFVAQAAFFLKSLERMCALASYTHNFGCYSCKLYLPNQLLWSNEFWLAPLLVLI